MIIVMGYCRRCLRQASRSQITGNVTIIILTLSGSIFDGIYVYTWDAENRLTVVETADLAHTNFGFPWKRLEFKYDYMGRRVQKRVYDVIDATHANEVSCRRYLYDGWSQVAEYNAPGGSALGSVLRTFTWGLDIARTLTDAGGVGALLQIADHVTGRNYLPSYDGNGNIVALFDAAASSGATACAAIYEYSPFGELLRCEGTYAKENPVRFSTKFTDDETSLVYYGKRFYSPSQGRFLGRDPSEEAGGLNLYGFCGNNPVNHFDVLGCDDFFQVWDPGIGWQWHNTADDDMAKGSYNPVDDSSFAGTYVADMNARNDTYDGYFSAIDAATPITSGQGLAPNRVPAGKVIIGTPLVKGDPGWVSAPNNNSQLKFDSSDTGVVKLGVGISAAGPASSISANYNVTDNTGNANVSVRPSMGFSGIAGPSMAVSTGYSGPTTASISATAADVVGVRFAANLTNINIFGFNIPIVPTSITLQVGFGFGGNANFGTPRLSISLINVTKDYNTGAVTKTGILTPNSSNNSVPPSH